MGTVGQRADGRWEAKATLPSRNGSRRRQSVYGKTEEEVVAKLKKLQGDLERGQLPVDQRLTVGAYLDHWLTTVVASRARCSTLAGYEVNVRRHIVPAIGSTPLARLRPSDVQRLLTLKGQEGLSPRTVQYIHAVLRAALNDAMREELVHRNVAEVVRGPSVRHTPVEPLTLAQVRTLFESISGHRHEALFVMAFLTGLRQGELLGLRWSDVDLDDRWLTVRQALQRVPGEARFGPPKSDRSIRGIEIPSLAAEALVRHRVAQAQARLLAGSKWRDHGLVFCTGVGTPLDHRNVTKSFQQALVNCGLPKKRFHDARHTAASFALAGGRQAREVMELLGHSQISLTMNTYAHLMREQKREMARTFDALFGAG
jgi:integrase